MMGYLVSEMKYCLYDVGFKDGIFYFTIRAALLEYILSMELRPEIIDRFLKIRKTTDQDRITFAIGESCKKTTPEELRSWAIEINLLLSIFNFLSIKNEAPLDTLFNNKEQLIMMVSGVGEGVIHAFPIGIGISARGREIIRQKYPQGGRLEVCDEVTLKTWWQYASIPKKDRHLYSTFCQSVVRECGTPGFVVPGDCACLGNNPDKYWNSGDLSSHNMDTASQQLTMLATIITFNEHVFGDV